MADIVRNVRGRGPGGWVRVTIDCGGRVPTDPIVCAFWRGESMAWAARRCQLPLFAVEAILRWYLQHPKALDAALGRER